MISLLSCVKEMDFGFNYGRMIMVDVTSDGAPATKANVNVKPEVLPLEIEGEDADMFTLTVKEEDFFFTENVATKGYNTTGDDFNDKYTSFRMDCFVPQNASIVTTLPGGDAVSLADAENNVYFSEETVTKGTSGWALENTYNWINNTDLTFWSIAPLADDGADYSNIEFADDHKSFTMDYALPEVSSNASDAVNQKDLVVSYQTKKVSFNTSGSTSDDGKVSLKFYHALSAIKFDLSEIPSEMTITKISLKNVSGEGTCTVTLSSGIPAFEWDDLGTANNTYSQAYSAGDFTSNVVSAGSEKIYMMIPQPFLDGRTKISIEYTSTKISGTHALSAYLYNNNKKSGVHGTGWSAGKIYTYKLSDVSTKLGVNVDDIVDTNIKSGLEITNASNVKCFVRVLMMGDWYDTNSRIYKGWDETQGTFTGKNTTDWTKGSDGFWYYKHPVDVGETIPSAKELFTTYTPPVQPEIGITLNIIIAAQSVPFDEDKTNAKNAWGDDCASYLTLN